MEIKKKGTIANTDRRSLILAKQIWYAIIINGKNTTAVLERQAKR